MNHIYRAIESPGQVLRITGTSSLMSLYLYLSIGISVLMLHINIIYGFNYPNAKGCDTSKRRPRALRILRNIPAPGSTLPFSMREIYDLLVPTR